MEMRVIQKCPLCGSEKFILIDPDPLQLRAGVSYVLKCECGALVALTVLNDPLQAKAPSK